MPFVDRDQYIDYLRDWYIDNKEQHIKNVLEYYYKNRTKILKQRKLKYKNSKKK
jgi:hypothetical protein